MGRPRRSSAHHADRLHVEIEHLLFFLSLDAVLAAQGDHLADDLDVEAFPFGLAQDVLDVIAERLLFLVEPLNPFYEREKLLAGNSVGLCGFGHFILLGLRQGAATPGSSPGATSNQPNKPPAPAPAVSGIGPSSGTLSIH